MDKRLACELRGKYMSDGGELSITSLTIIEDPVDREELYRLTQSALLERASGFRLRASTVSYGARDQLKRKFAGQLGAGSHLRQALFALAINAGNICRYALSGRHISPSWLAYALS